ncbi:MAG TPA: PqqD family protein [Sphingomicrobium sp.]
MTVVTKLSDLFTETDIDHEVVIMRLDNGEFFSLSGTAASIWRLIDGERDTAGLAAAMASEFDPVDCDIAGDVNEFLQHLKDMGLVADA